MVAGLSPFEKTLVCVPCPRHDVPCWDKLLASMMLFKKKKKNCSRLVPSKVCQLSHAFLSWIISSLCIDELFLHMVENTILTYAKVFCSLVLIDSFFSSCDEKCALSPTSL